MLKHCHSEALASILLECFLILRLEDQQYKSMAGSVQRLKELLLYVSQEIQELFSMLHLINTKATLHQMTTSHLHLTS